MLSFIHAWGLKIVLIVAVSGCVASRIQTVMLYFHPNDVSTIVCAIVYAVVAGALVDAVIIMSRPSDFKAIRNLALTGFVGALFGITALSHSILVDSYGYDHGYGEWDTSIFLGAIVGTVCSLATYLGIVESYRQAKDAITKNESVKQLPHDV